MTTVFCDFTFEAAHSLPHLPSTHKCARTHGHSYKVRVECGGPVDPVTMFVADYAEIARVFQDRIFDVLDHRNINDVLQPSTSENLAKWIFDQMSGSGLPVSRVTVRETETAGAMYSPAT